MTDENHTSSTQDDQLLVLAFYIVIDVSYSMKEDDAMGAANGLIPAVMDAIHGESKPRRSRPDRGDRLLR